MQRAGWGLVLALLLTRPAPAPAFPGGEQTYQTRGGGSTPVVIQLTDDDGDGRITECDTPDIFSTTQAFSGDTGAELWEFDDPRCPFQPSAPAAGDIDGDGWNEIVKIDGEGHVCAIRSDGTFAWRSTDAVLNFVFKDSLSIWDLDGDTTAEVVANGLVVRGADGSTVFNVPSWGYPAISDLDLDGQWEVIANSRAYEPDGTPVAINMQQVEHGSCIVDLDGDPYPEIVAGGGLTLVARDHDGTLLWRTDGLRIECAPCAGDFDGDGLAEIAVATGDTFYAFDQDGSILWQKPDENPGSITSGCVVFDFDGDGTLEIAHRDYVKMSIYDARDGTVLWSQGVAGCLAHQVPVVADVDADGHADLLSAATAIQGQRGGVAVWSNPSWAPARRVWNQENYSVEHVTEAGAIVSNPAPRWLVSNDFRRQDAGCACPVPARVDIIARPDCATGAPCFEADRAGLSAFSWDFGDGSPAVTSARACHEYMGAGPHVVRLSFVDATGCAGHAARVVELAELPQVVLAGPPPCAASPACVTATVTGGVPPFTFEWDFGDGSPRIGGGASECRDFADGTHLVACVVRDAAGCIAENVVTVVAGTGWAGSLPEVSGLASSEPLRVAREGARLVITVEDVGLPTSLHEGRIELLRPSGYTHESVACDGSSLLRMTPAPGNRYYLVTATPPCGAPPRPEGSYGRNSFGTERPSARMLGLTACP